MFDHGQDRAPISPGSAGGNSSIERHRCSIFVDVHSCEVVSLLCLRNLLCRRERGSAGGQMQEFSPGEFHGALPHWWVAAAGYLNLTSKRRGCNGRMTLQWQPDAGSLYSRHPMSVLAHRVISWRYGSSVAFGATRTFSEQRLPNRISMSTRPRFNLVVDATKAESRRMTRVERLWKLRLAFSELVCNRIFTRPAAGSHLLSRNVVLAGTVAFTPGSQLSQGHRIQCVWNGRSSHPFSRFCSGTRHARGRGDRAVCCGGSPIASAPQNGSRRRGRSRRRPQGQISVNDIRVFLCVPRSRHQRAVRTCPGS